MTPYYPSVTVLMPVYNGSAYLNASVNSILWQTHRDFEFLIVDDGSTDGSDVILADLASRDRRIRVFRNGHQGVVAAINRGIAEARGDFIVRMDADDIAWPERIERQLAFLGANPQVAAVGCAVRIIDGKGRPLQTGRYPISPAQVLEHLQSGNSSLASPATTVRRDALIAAGGLRPPFIYAEDFDLLLRLSERYDLANLPDILLDYRVHGHNVSIQRRREQALAAHIARLSARERRLGRPDPTATLERLRLADLDRFNMLPHERNSILFSLSEAALASYEASEAARYLADAEESLFIHGYHHPARARRIAHRLAQHWWKEGRRRRCLGILAIFKSNPKLAAREQTGARLRSTGWYIAPIRQVRKQSPRASNCRLKQ
jgi:glycosyltransferase involved in cell wall biosynthesis